MSRIEEAVMPNSVFGMSVLEQQWKVLFSFKEANGTLKDDMFVDICTQITAPWLASSLGDIDSTKGRSIMLF